MLSLNPGRLVLKFYSGNFANARSSLEIQKKDNINYGKSLKTKLGIPNDVVIHPDLLHIL